MSNERSDMLRRLIRDTNAVLDAHPGFGLAGWVAQFEAERKAKRAAWWASLTRWQRVKWHAGRTWYAVRWYFSNLLDALLGRDGVA